MCAVGSISEFRRPEHDGKAFFTKLLYPHLHASEDGLIGESVGRNIVTVRTSLERQLHDSQRASSWNLGENLRTEVCRNVFKWSCAAVCNLEDTIDSCSRSERHTCFVYSRDTPQLRKTNDGTGRLTLSESPRAHSTHMKAMQGTVRGQQR